MVAQAQSQSEQKQGEADKKLDRPKTVPATTSASSHDGLSPSHHNHQDNNSISKRTRRSLRHSLHPHHHDPNEHTFTFPAEASGRVVLRLERLMGSANVRPVDPTYMKTLRGKLEEEEKLRWKDRSFVRRKVEFQRCLKLVVDGKSIPLEGMEDVSKHPVFRTNRILNRLSSIEMQVEQQFQTKPPPIFPREPFQEFEATGVLFGFHPNHYLKVQKERNVPPEGEDGMEEMPYFFAPPQEGVQRDSLAKGTEQLEPPINQSTTLPSPPSKLGDEAMSPSTKDSGILAPSHTPLLLDTTSAHGMKSPVDEVKERYGIKLEDIEKTWEKYESPLIQMINSTSTNETLELFDLSDKVLDVFQGEEIFYIHNFMKKTKVPRIALASTTNK